MSYVRWSSKVVQDCDVCKNVGWVAMLPEYPTWLTWRGHMEGGDPEDRVPHCCTSCWYIYDDVGGWLAVYHAGTHVCAGPDGEGYDCVRIFNVEEAKAWVPPEWCRHRQVALDMVAEWITEQPGEQEDD